MRVSVKKLTINYDMIQYETIWNNMKSKKRLCDSSPSPTVLHFRARLKTYSFVVSSRPIWWQWHRVSHVVFFDVCQTMWNNKSQQSNLWEFVGLPTITKVFILPRTNIKTVQNIKWIRHKFKMSYCIYLYVILHIDTQNWKNTCKYYCILILKLQPPNDSLISTVI